MGDFYASFRDFYPSVSDFHGTMRKNQSPTGDFYPSAREFHPCPTRAGDGRTYVGQDITKTSPRHQVRIIAFNICRLLAKARAVVSGAIS